MKSLLKKWFRGKERGQGMVEYGLIIGLIAVIVVAIFIALGPQIKKLFEGAVSSGHIEKMESAME
ncbi:MAG: Flp family type IVb pilin [bacterium]